MAENFVYERQTLLLTSASILNFHIMHYIVLNGHIPSNVESLFQDDQAISKVKLHLFH